MHCAGLRHSQLWPWLGMLARVSRLRRPATASTTVRLYAATRASATVAAGPRLLLY